MRKFKGNEKPLEAEVLYLLLMLRRETHTALHNSKIDCIHMGFKAEWQKRAVQACGFYALVSFPPLNHK